MKIVEIILTEKINPKECWSEEMSASQILAEIDMTAQPPEDANRKETVFRRYIVTGKQIGRAHV